MAENTSEVSQEMENTAVQNNTPEVSNETPGVSVPNSSIENDFEDHTNYDELFAKLNNTQSPSIDNPKPTEKTHDMFLNILTNPTYSMEDFMDVGYTANNVTLKSKDSYLNNDLVKKAFTDQNGEFNEKAFSEVYDSAKILRDGIVEIADSYDMQQQFVYDPNNIYAPDEQKIDWNDPNNKKLQVVYNPYRQNNSLTTIGQMGPRQLSDEEIAQTQKIYDPATDTWNESPNDESFFAHIFDTRVLAQWEFDADENGNPTEDENKIVYKKGQYKTNDNGTFYYEELNGRSVDGKVVLNKFNTITTDGSWINQFDPLDSDDINQKSMIGTVAKNAVLIGTMFIPYIGPVIAGASLLTQLGGLFSTAGKMVTGSDSPILNSIEGFAQSWNRQTLRTEYAKTHTWCFESWFSTCADLLAQIREQRILFEWLPAIFKGNKLKSSIDWGFDEQKQLKFQQELISKRRELLTTQASQLAKKRALKAGVTEKEGQFTMQSVADAQFLEKAANMQGMADFVAYQQSYNKIGEVASKVYMAGLMASPMYGELKLAGADDVDASIFTFARFAAEMALLNTPIGDFFLPEMRINKLQWQNTARAAMNAKTAEGETANAFTRTVMNQIKSTPRPAADASTIEKQNYFKKVLNFFKSLPDRAASGQFKGNTARLTFNASFAGGLESGIVNDIEELFNDLTKSAWNAKNYFVGSDERIGAFENNFDRYGMGMFAGIVGGGVNSAFTNYKAVKQQSVNSFDEAMKQLVYIVRNNQTTEYKDYINKHMTLASRNLSTRIIPGTESYDVAKDYYDSQDYACKKALFDQIDLIERAADANGAKVSDDSLMGLHTDLLKEFRLGILSESATVGRSVQTFNTVANDIVKLSLALNEAKGAKIQNSDNSEMTDSQKVAAKKEAKEANSNESNDAIKQKEIEKIQEQLNEKIQLKDDILSGKRAPEMIAAALVEMTPGINQNMIPPTFETYCAAVTHKKYNEIDSDTIEKLKKEYEVFNQADKALAADALSKWYLEHGRNSSAYLKETIQNYLLRNENINIEKINNIVGLFRVNQMRNYANKTKGDKSFYERWDEMLQETYSEDANQVFGSFVADENGFVYTKQLAQLVYELAENLGYSKFDKIKNKSEKLTTLLSNLNKFQKLFADSIEHFKNAKDVKASDVILFGLTQQTNALINDIVQKQKQQISKLNEIFETNNDKFNTKNSLVADNFSTLQYYWRKYKKEVENAIEEYETSKDKPNAAFTLKKKLKKINKKIRREFDFFIKRINEEIEYVDNKSIAVKEDFDKIVKEFEQALNENKEVVINLDKTLQNHTREDIENIFLQINLATKDMQREILLSFKNLLEEVISNGILKKGMCDVQTKTMLLQLISIYRDAKQNYNSVINDTILNNLVDRLQATADTSKLKEYVVEKNKAVLKNFIDDFNTTFEQELSTKKQDIIQSVNINDLRYLLNKAENGRYENYSDQQLIDTLFDKKESKKIIKINKTKIKNDTECLRILEDITNIKEQLVEYFNLKDIQQTKIFENFITNQKHYLNTQNNTIHPLLQSIFYDVTPKLKQIMIDFSSQFNFLDEETNTIFYFDKSTLLDVSGEDGDIIIEPFINIINDRGKNESFLNKKLLSDYFSTRKNATEIAELNNLESEEREIKKLSDTPIVNLLQQFINNETDQSFQVNDLLYKFEKIFNQTVPIYSIKNKTNINKTDLTKYNFDFADYEQLVGLIRHLKSLRSIVACAVNDDLSLGKLSCFNATLNAVAKKVNLEGWEDLLIIDSNSGNVLLTDINKLLATLEHYKTLFEINNKKKILSTKKAQLNYQYIIYNRFKNFAENIRTVFLQNGDDKEVEKINKTIIAALVNAKTLENYYKTNVQERALTVPPDVENKMFEEIVAIKDAFYDLFKDDISVERLQKYFNTDVFSSLANFRGNNFELNETTQDIDDKNFLAELSSWIGVKASSFYDLCQKTSDNLIIDINSQQIAIHHAVSHLVNGDVTKNVVKALQLSILKEEKSIETTNQLEEYAKKYNIPSGYVEILKEKFDKGEIKNTDLIESIEIPFFENSILIQGLAGTGKTSVIIKNAIKIATQINPKLSSKILVLSGVNSDGLKESLQKSFNVPKENVKYYADFINEISEEYKNTKEDKNNLIDKKPKRTKSGITYIDYDLNANTNDYSLIVFDEVTNATSPEIATLDNYCNQKNISMICSGDFNQSTKVVQSKSNYEVILELLPNMFMTTPKQGVVLRSGNTQVINNNSILNNITTNFLLGNEKIESELHYFKTEDGELRGHRILYKNDIKEWQSEIDIMLNKLEDNEKIGLYIEKNDDEIYQYIVSKGLEDKVEIFNKDKKAQGLEMRFFILHQKENLNQTNIKDFYTNATRGIQATLIVADKQNFKIKNCKAPDKFSVIEKISQKAIDSYAVYKKRQYEAAIHNPEAVTYKAPTKTDLGVELKAEKIETKDDLISFINKKNQENREKILDELKKLESKLPEQKIIDEQNQQLYKYPYNINQGFGIGCTFQLLTEDGSQYDFYYVTSAQKDNNGNIQNVSFEKVHDGKTTEETMSVSEYKKMIDDSLLAYPNQQTDATKEESTITVEQLDKIINELQPKIDNNETITIDDIRQSAKNNNLYIPDVLLNTISSFINQPQLKPQPVQPPKTPTQTSQSKGSKQLDELLEYGQEKTVMSGTLIDTGTINDEEINDVTMQFAPLEQPHFDEFLNQDHGGGLKNNFMTAYTQTTLVPGVKFDNNGNVEMLDNDVNYRIDSVNGLIKLITQRGWKFKDGIGIDVTNGRTEKVVYLEILNELRSDVFFATSQKNLLRRLSATFNKYFDIANIDFEASWIFKSCNVVKTKNDYIDRVNKKDKNDYKSFESKTLLCEEYDQLLNVKKDNSQDGVLKKTISLVIGTKADGDLMELPIFTLRSPFSLIAEINEFKNEFTGDLKSFSDQLQKIWVGKIDKQKLQKVIELLDTFLANKNLDTPDLKYLNNLRKIIKFYTKGGGYVIELKNFSPYENNGHSIGSYVVSKPRTSMTNNVQIDYFPTVKEISEETFKNFEAVSNIMIGGLKSTNGKVGDINIPDHTPFILVTQDPNLHNASSAELLNIFIKQQENPKMVKSVSVVLLHSPIANMSEMNMQQQREAFKTNFDAYIELLYKIINKEQTNVFYGTNYTAYHLVKTLWNDESFLEAIQNPQKVDQSCNSEGISEYKINLVRELLKKIEEKANALLKERDDLQSYDEALSAVLTSQENTDLFEIFGLKNNTTDTYKIFRLILYNLVYYQDTIKVQEKDNWYLTVDSTNSLKHDGTTTKIDGILHKTSNNIQLIVDSLIKNNIKYISIRCKADTSETVLENNNDFFYVNVDLKNRFQVNGQPFMMLGEINNPLFQLNIEACEELFDIQTYKSESITNEDMSKPYTIIQNGQSWTRSSNKTLYRYAKNGINKESVLNKNFKEILLNKKLDITSDEIAYLQGLKLKQPKDLVIKYNELHKDSKLVLHGQEIFVMPLKYYNGSEIVKLPFDVEISTVKRKNNHRFLHLNGKRFETTIKGKTVQLDCDFIKTDDGNIVCIYTSIQDDSTQDILNTEQEGTDQRTGTKPPSSPRTGTKPPSSPRTGTKPPSSPRTGTDQKTGTEQTNNETKNTCSLQQTAINAFVFKGD